VFPSLTSCFFGSIPWFLQAAIEDDGPAPGKPSLTREKNNRYTTTHQFVVRPCASYQRCRPPTIPHGTFPIAVAV
jgi:hypothetical protein